MKSIKQKTTPRRQRKASAADAILLPVKTIAFQSRASAATDDGFCCERSAQSKRLTKDGNSGGMR